MQKKGTNSPGPLRYSCHTLPFAHGMESKPLAQHEAHIARSCLQLAPSSWAQALWPFRPWACSSSPASGLCTGPLQVLLWPCPSPDGPPLSPPPFPLALTLTVAPQSPSDVPREWRLFCPGQRPSEARAGTLVPPHQGPGCLLPESLKPPRGSSWAEPGLREGRGWQPGSRQSLQHPPQGRQPVWSLRAQAQGRGSTCPWQPLTTRGPCGCC